MEFHDHCKLVWLPVTTSAILGAGFILIGGWEFVGGSSSVPALAAIAAGIVAIVCSSVFSRYAESIRVTFDSGSRRVELVGRLPWRQRRATWSFDEVDTIEPESWDDGDSGPLWRPVLVLKRGDRVPLIANWHRSRLITDDVCERARLVMQS